MTLRLSAFVGVASFFLALAFAGSLPASAEEQKCPENDSGLSLPNGFCATVFADKIGHARQLAVTPDGTVYVNTWSGVYYNNDKPQEGGFLVALKDTKGTGHADVNRTIRPDLCGRRAWWHRHLALQKLALRRNRRQDRSLCAEERRGRADRQVGDDLERHADHRRPPDASLRHRR